MTMELRITELDMDGREPNYYQVTAIGEEYSFDPPVFESEDLMECVKYCYDLGVNFAVYTLAAWYRQNSETCDECGATHDPNDIVTIYGVSND